MKAFKQKENLTKRFSNSFENNESKLSQFSGIGDSVHNPVIHKKLMIGEPNDKHEIEAENVANRVVNQPERTLQMQPIEEEEEELQMQPLEDEDEIQMQPNDDEIDEELQMAPQESKVSRLEVSDSMTRELSKASGDGTSLPKDVNNEMSQKIGRDFSDVSIHTNDRAALMSKNIGARAFTHGNDIYFNSGEYNPGSQKGKHLLAHELTHVVQQGNSTAVVQADFAEAPTTPDREVVELSDAQITEAIEYNQDRHSDANEIALMRDIIGISPQPSEINEDFVRAIVRYQAQYGLTQDGKLGLRTAERLAKEIIAAGDYLGENDLGDLKPEFTIKTSLRTLITADNRSYTDYKTAIQAGTMVQRLVALLDQQLLIDLKSKLSWNSWAKCIELLGRRAPSGNTMRRSRTVRAAMRSAWGDSDPDITIWAVHDPDTRFAGHACNPAPGTHPVTSAHEEGGFVYMNLITGILTTRRVPAGGQAALVLDNPPNVTNSIVVGGFHTHPNVGNCWGAPFFSPADNTWSTDNGLPILMIGAFPGIADTSFHATGQRRRHLAGNRGMPGAAGGLAPQATRVGDHDEL